MYEIRDHPHAPDLAALGEFLMEPVDPAEIRERRDAGEELLETNLLDLDEVDAYVELDDEPAAPGSTDVGTVLYRLVQLFGTPQFEAYVAGGDVSWRDDETFKYLFEVTRQDGPGEWLVTVHDWRVRLGVSAAAWAEDEDAEPPAIDPDDAIALLALVVRVVTNAVHCEYEDVPY